MATPHADDGIDLEVLVDIEQQLYDVGYSEGLQHGKIHGNIEGRQLGREKGFELWEELGFYEGFARFWRALSEHGQGKDNRINHSAGLLLDLIARFPTENTPDSDFRDLDVPKIFAQIRARYKVLCSILGVKPSLRALHSHASTSAGDDNADLRQFRGSSLWSAESKQDSGPADYSF